MTRVSENQILRQLMSDVYNNRQAVNKFSSEVSSGLKVQRPGDSSRSASIAEQRDVLLRVENYAKRAENTVSLIVAKDNAMNSLNDRMVRLKEIATQAANETLSPDNRLALASEAYEIRDTIRQLANTTYLGRYIFSGNQDDELVQLDATPFASPTDATDRAAQRYTIDDGTTHTGLDGSRNVRITDDISIDINYDARDSFGYAIQAATRLARGLDGYRTEPILLEGAVDGTVPRNLTAGTTTNGYDADANGLIEGAEYELQTSDMQRIIEQIEYTRAEHVLPGLNQLGGKLARVESAQSLLQLTAESAQTVISNLQDADITESATNLSQMQTALEASLTVTTRVLNLSILNYL